MADMTAPDAATPDPTAGAPADTAPDDAAAPEVLVTISKAPDGTYLVQAGDEPEDDEAAAPAAPGAPADAGAATPATPEPVPCKTIGEALKAALDILQGESGGGEANEEEDFQSGYGDDKTPKIAQKY